MTYFFLILLAIIFAMLGFLLHAFYFSDARDSKLAGEVVALRKELEEKQQEAREVQEEVATATRRVHALEQEVSQRNREMESLQRMADQQDEEIDLLRREATAIRTAIAAPPDDNAVSEEAGSKSIAPGDIVEATPAEMDTYPVDPSSTRQQSGRKKAKTKGAKGAQKDKPPPEAMTPEKASWRENLEEAQKTLDATEKELDEK
jgi:FtsZ-interacting cell division protein ZipA